MKVWIEGEVVDGGEARVPVLDHGLLYGDGVFEGMRVYGRRVFRLEDHLQRFAMAAKALALELPGGTAAVREIVLETTRAFGADEAYVRLIATRGDGPLGIDPTRCSRPRLICIVDRINLHRENKCSPGVDLLTSSWANHRRRGSGSRLREDLVRVSRGRPRAWHPVLVRHRGALGSGRGACFRCIR